MYILQRQYPLLLWMLVSPWCLSLFAAAACAEEAAIVQGAAPVTAPVTAGAEKLSLSDAVARALSASVEVQAAQADLSAQVERRRGAWSDIGPRVKVDYNQVHFPGSQSFQLSPSGPPLLLRPEESRSGSVTVAQPITGAGALITRARFEGAQEEVKETSLTLTRGDIAFTAAETWLRAYGAQRQLEIANASVAAAESQMKDGAALERAGRINRGDTLKLELAVSEGRGRAAQARAALDVVMAMLKEAIGLHVDAPLVLENTLPPMVSTAPELGPALHEAEASRLELRQAKAAVVAAEFNKKLAYSNFSPSINLFTKWDHNFGELTALGGERDLHTYGIQASWDLWNNGAHIFAVREAAENIIRAEELGRGIDQRIRLDVLQALANLKSAKEQLALAKTAVSQAEEAYRIEKARFRTGSRSATDLILAETSQASAEGRLVSAQTDLVLWNFKMQKALGALQPKL